MNKDSYNVDDILSEVKKRREENEARLHNQSVNEIQSPEKEATKKESKFDINENNSDVDRLVDSVIDDVMGVTESKTHFEIHEEPAISPEIEEKAENSVENVKADTISFKAGYTSEIIYEPFEEDENEEESSNDEYEDVYSSDETDEKNAVEEEEEDVEIDLLAFSNDSKKKNDEKGEEKPKFSKTKKGKIVITIICVLLGLIIAVAGFGIYYVSEIMNKVTDDEGYKKTDTSYHGMDFLQENFPAIEEVDASEVENYKEYLKSWYKNGDPVSSTHVINVMLIGEDTREEEISDTSRADSAIIASINVDTGTITLTSILRDLFVYFEVDGEGQYGKINAAASLGGMEEYIRTVERYYKIQIDNYAVVNFASFPKIIDSLGGVDIKITDREIYEINNHQKRYGGVWIDKTFEGTEGTMTLDGKQALAYCRIRKIDSDGKRADRQKTVLLQIVNQVKGSSPTDILNLGKEVADYVYTGYTAKELLALGNYALKNNWLSYQQQSFNVPTPEHAKGGIFTTYYDVHPTDPYHGTWLWKSDIPQDAYDLQMKIYGKSNITLAENRCDYVSIY